MIVGSSVRAHAQRFGRHSNEQNRVHVHLIEWSSLLPSSEGEGKLLRDLSFGDASHLLTRAVELDRAGVVTISERRDGLSIHTRSFVGRVALGPLQITIAPKISWARWLTLVRRALHLRGVIRSERLGVEVDTASLQDLIVLEFLAEARDLIGRGLHREYSRQRRSLATPRGRVDFQQIARRGGLFDAAIPSRFTRRSDNSILNRALLAGLLLATRRAGDRGLRADAHRLAAELEGLIEATDASTELVSVARKSLDRRTRRYEPSLQLIQLLIDGSGVTLQDQEGESRVMLDGFALDMNRLWQRLLGNTLREWAEGIEVREEFALRAVYQRNPSFPLRRSLPRPRPDFAAFANGRLLGYLDAKYRDLWEHPLPREMLYQLSLYAMAQGHGTAAILYPTDATEAIEQRIDIGDPVTRAIRASVALRPVSLTTLEQLITAPPSASRLEDRRAFANALLGHH